MKEVLFPDIPLEEYNLRKKKMIELMKKHGLDGLCLFSPLNLRYYFGYRKASYGASDWWRRAAIINAAGETIIIVPQIHWILIQKTTWIENVRPWGGPPYLNFPQNFMDLFIDSVRELKMSEGRIGFELDTHTHPDLSFLEFEEIRRRLPRARIVDGSPLYWEQRQVKTDHELKIIRKLCEITVKGVQAGFEAVREGITEKEVYTKMWETWIREGLHDCPMAGRMMMRSGVEKYNFMNAPPYDRKLKKGEGLFVDGGPCHLGYFTDVQRVIHVGEPDALQKKLHAAANEAMDAMIAIVKDGTPVKEIFNAGLDTLRRVLPESKHTLSMVGHGMGLQTHEPPYIMGNSEENLKADMFIALEINAADVPQYRVVGGFPEENLIVTRNGCENLTKDLRRDLWVVP